MSEIILENISKTYDDQHYAVKDINLTIEDGEFIIFVGPSGCGKSTTLRMIAGLESISEGKLYIGDREMSRASPRDRDLAMVFQDFALYPNMTVYKNLQYPLRMHKVDKDEADRTIRRAADLLGLDDLLERKPSQLSGGQKQRVALGRAIVRQPKAFLMDEPLSNLDAKLRVDMRYEISQLHQTLDTTVVYVTHDQTEAMTMGDRIVVMNHGNIQQVGTPEKIYANPKNVFVAEFIGTPKINLFERELREGQVMWSGEEQIPVDAEDQEVLVGVRPENLKLSYGRSYTVKMIENLGSEQHIFLEGEDHQVVVQVAYDDDIRIGEQYDLSIIKPERINLFSAASQEALRFQEKDDDK